MAPKGCVKLSFHVTGSEGPSFEGDDEKKTMAIAGRADMREIISQSTLVHQTLGIAGELARTFTFLSRIELICWLLCLRFNSLWTF